MNKILRYSLTYLILLGLQFSVVELKGKTYDDLDDILKHDGLNSTKTHVQHTEAMDQGAHIDPTKVVHKPPPKIEEDRAMTSGVVIPKAYTASNPTARKSNNQTRTYEQYAKKQDSQPDSMPLKYLKIPKRDRDAQFYFFLSTLLLLATTITIISSCGCLFYFLLKNLVTMQEQMVDDQPNDDNQREQERRQQSNQQQRNNNNFIRFEDEEQIQRDEVQQKQDNDRLPNLLGRSGQQNQEFK